MKVQITYCGIIGARLVIRGRPLDYYKFILLEGNHRIIPGVGWWVEVDASHAIQRRVVAP